MPKVSVIIPAYNSSLFISEAIESVFNQTFKDFEIIVVDDGSTDNTKDVLKPYMNQIQYIFKENGGVASARNIGIKLSRGEYLAFLDQDDIWMPNKLALQVGILDERLDVGLVHSDNLILINNRISKETRKNKIKDKRILEGNIINNLLLGKFCLAASTVMVRKICIDTVGFFDESLNPADDFDMWIRILQKWKCSYVATPLIKYRIHSKNVSKDFEKLHYTVFKVLNKFFGDQSLPQEIKKLKRRIWSNYHYRCGAAYYCSGEFKKAKLSLKKSLEYFPFRVDSYLCLIKCMLGYKLMNELRLLKVSLKRIIRKITRR